MKRLQVSIKNETHSRVFEIVDKCNEGFEDGIVRPQDVVDWVLANAPFDIAKIQSRCLSPARIISKARLEYIDDADQLIKKLTQVKALLKTRGKN